MKILLASTHLPLSTACHKVIKYPLKHGTLKIMEKQANMTIFEYIISFTYVYVYFDKNAQKKVHEVKQWFFLKLRLVDIGHVLWFEWVPQK